MMIACLRMLTGIRRKRQAWEQERCPKLCGLFRFFLEVAKGVHGCFAMRSLPTAGDHRGYWLAAARKRPAMWEVAWAAFTSYRNPKYFLFHLSHQIFKHMHETLNVGKKKTNCIVCL
jgi:hypothetical protein